MITTLTTKGQVVIPARVRKRLRLREGIKFSVDVRDRQIVLQPLSDDPIEEGFGMFAGAPLLDTLLEMRREEKVHDKKDRAR